MVSQQVDPAPARPPGELAGLSSDLVDLDRLHRQQVTEKVIGYLLLACAVVSVLTTIGIIFVLLKTAIEFFLEVPIWDFLFGRVWTPLFKGQEMYGVLPLVSATLMVSLIAMLLAVPLGLMSAIYLAEYASPRARSFLKPFLELLAGIPTIVYGYFALTFITPSVLKPLFASTNVYNVAAAGLAVGIMVLPMIASLSEDALRAVPRSLREGGFGLGATRFEVSIRILVPAALSGIVASVILAISRAVGETMIVALAAGSKAQIASNPLEPAQTMTGYIVQVVSGDVVRGSTVYKSLFAVGLLLFLMTLLMNVISNIVVTRFREEYS